MRTVHPPTLARRLALPLLLLSAAPFARAQDDPAAPASTPAAAAFDLAPLEAAARELLEDARGRRGFPGAGAGVVLADGRSFGVVTGAQDAAGAIPLGPDDQFLSGSIGKTYCAAIVLQLIGDGKLALDQRVATVLGERPWYAAVPNADAITLRHLLTHRSGIPEHVWKDAFQRRVLAEPDRAPDPVECVGFIAGDAPLFAPGTDWSYADTNFVLLGLVVEAVTGAPFAAALERRLLVPLELTATAWNDGRAVPRLVDGHASGVAFHRGSTVTEGRYFVDASFEYCGGGLRSTPRDLARWGHALFAGDVVPADLRAAQRTGVPCDRRVADGYGLGCFVLDTPLGPAFGHSGFMPGFQAMLEHFERPRLTVALMWNTDDGRKVGNPRRAAEELAARLVALLPPPASAAPGDQAR
ncbi:MAG: serine hydrolase domain-containing protein [Planctomycetota bacterium]